MSMEWSNFKARIKRFADSAKIITVVAAIAYSVGAPPAAQAQSVGQVLNQGLSLLNGGSPVPRSLPPTNLDSFVYQSGYSDAIYGDESTGLPPYYGFTADHRINAGITGQNAAGLTTGHGSFMPDAWGADEFLYGGGEWAMSGNGTGQQAIQATGLNAAQLMESSIGTGIDLLLNGGSQATSLLNGIAPQVGVNINVNGQSTSINATISAPSGGGSLPGF
jgi:hypothetical protein